MATIEWRDEIVDEVHQWRRELLAEFGGDLARYVVELMREQEACDEELVSFEEIDDDEFARFVDSAKPTEITGH